MKRICKTSSSVFERFNTLTPLSLTITFSVRGFHPAKDQKREKQLPKKKFTKQRENVVSLEKSLKFFKGDEEKLKIPATLSANLFEMVINVRFEPGFSKKIERWSSEDNWITYSRAKQGRFVSRLEGETRKGKGNSKERRTWSKLAVPALMTRFFHRVPGESRVTRGWNECKF